MYDAKFGFIVILKILKMRKFIDLASVERKFYRVIKRWKVHAFQFGNTEFQQ